MPIDMLRKGVISLGVLVALSACSSAGIDNPFEFAVGVGSDTPSSSEAAASKEDEEDEACPTGDPEGGGGGGGC